MQSTTLTWGLSQYPLQQRRFLIGKTLWDLPLARGKAASMKPYHCWEIFDADRIVNIQHAHLATEESADVR